MKFTTFAIDHPVTDLARKDFTTLPRQSTVGAALETIRNRGIGERIIYFYVIDEKDRLVGVLPTRRLLISALDRRLEDIMLTPVTAIPASATALEACEFFVLHRFLAFPVVDDHRHLVGVVDVSQFTGEVLDLAERAQTDTTFEALGFRLSEVRKASPWVAFKYRFPWLLATIAGGMACAVIAARFEQTLAAVVVVAFFLALVLGLGESVGAQSMSVAIQRLRALAPTWRNYRAAFKREFLTALLIGGGCGITVFVLAWIWRGSLAAAAVIGVAIGLSLILACVFGLTVPWLLHGLKLDPKIAAGPVTLALTDLTTLLIYFHLATLLRPG